MNKYIYFLLFPFIYLYACSLSVEQEQALSRDLGNYISARENCNTLKEVSLTHKLVVESARKSGDAHFKKRFFCISNYHVQDISLDGVEETATALVATYTIRYQIFADTMNADGSEKLLAISTTKGANWFFVREMDLNVPGLKKIITKK